MPLLVVGPGLHSEDSTMVAPVCWTISGQQNRSGSEISISNEDSLNVTSHLLACFTYLSTILSTYLYLLASFKAFSKIIKNWLLDHAPTDRSDSTILNSLFCKIPAWNLNWQAVEIFLGALLLVNFPWLERKSRSLWPQCMLLLQRRSSASPKQKALRLQASTKSGHAKWCFIS